MKQGFRKAEMKAVVKAVKMVAWTENVAVGLLVTQMACTTVALKVFELAAHWGNE